MPTVSYHLQTLHRLGRDLICAGHKVSNILGTPLHIQLYADDIILVSEQFPEWFLPQKRDNPSTQYCMLDSCGQWRLEALCVPIDMQWRLEM